VHCWELPVFWSPLQSVLLPTLGCPT
jgi:hypothetical protein